MPRVWGGLLAAILAVLVPFAAVLVPSAAASATTIVKADPQPSWGAHEVDPDMGHAQHLHGTLDRVFIRRATTIRLSRSSRRLHVGRRGREGLLRGQDLVQARCDEELDEGDESLQVLRQGRLPVRRAEVKPWGTGGSWGLSKLAVYYSPECGAPYCPWGVATEDASAEGLRGLLVAWLTGWVVGKQASWPGYSTDSLRCTEAGEPVPLTADPARRLRHGRGRVGQRVRERVVRIHRGEQARVRHPGHDAVASNEHRPTTPRADGERRISGGDQAPRARRRRGRPASLPRGGHVRRAPAARRHDRPGAGRD